MLKYLRIIIAIFVFYSCDTDESQLNVVEYYPDSKIIRSETFFNSAKDSILGNFTTIEYDSLGIEKSKYRCKNYKLDGRAYTFYSNGNIERSSNFKSGKETGVRKIFTEEGHLTNEILVINGKDILWKVFIEYTKIKSYGYKIYPVRNHTAYEYEGRIIYDTLMNIIDSVTFYYDIHKVDSLKSGEIKLNVKILGTAYDEYKTNINLILGELNVDDISNNKNSLRDTTRIIESEKNDLEFTICQTNIENNLLTGLLQLELFSLDGSEKIDDIYFTFYYDLNSE